MQQAFRKQFTANEWATILKSGPQHESLFRLHWSLKEAIVKARGDGIVFDLQRIDIHLPADFTATPSTEGLHALAKEKAPTEHTPMPAVSPPTAADTQAATSTTGAPAPTPAPPAPQRQAPVRVTGIRISIDGVPAPQWRLSSTQWAGHWFSVARCRPEDIIDSIGEFRATMQKGAFSSAEWEAAADAPFPDFREVSLVELLPAGRALEYRRRFGD